MAVGWIFFSHYGSGDTIVFFEKAKAMAALPLNEYLDLLFSASNYEVSKEPRVLFFTKFLSLITFITSESYWISSLYISTMNFFATWFLVKVLKEIYPKIINASIICFLILPSVVFWSSGILKDTFSFAAVSLLISSCLKLYHRKSVSISEIILGLASLFILLKLKHYLLVSFFLFVGLLAFLTLIRKSNIKYKVLAIFILILAFGSTQFIHPYLKTDRLVQTIYENNQSITQNTKQENKLSIYIESPEITSLVKEIPEALHIGLFRPSLFDFTSGWGWFHKVENTILTFLFFLSILLLVKERPKIDFPLISASIFTILILAVLLALSTPNFGTLVRYKNAFLPYFFLLCSILPYRFLLQKLDE